MKHARILTLLFIPIMLLAIVALSVGSDANAQGDGTATPPPEADVFKYDEPARVENGEAEWVLNETRFVNNYPNGFIFLGNADSSGGEIVSVSIYYSHTPLWEDDARVRGEVDAETGGLRVEVTGTDAYGIPPWLPVNYRWRISDEAGTVYWSDWVVGEEYADTTRRWTRLDTEDATFFVQAGLPDDITDFAQQYLADTHALYLATFGRELSFAPRILLFANRDAFTEWRGPEFDTNGTIIVGQTNPQWGAIVQFMFREDPLELANTVVHEVAHLYQYDVFEFRAPGWFIEGNATYYEVTGTQGYLDRVLRAAPSGDLPRLFVNFGPQPDGRGPDGSGRWGYDVGYSFMVYFIETYGYDAHLQLVKLLGEPETVGGFEVEGLVLSNRLKTVDGD